MRGSTARLMALYGQGIVASANAKFQIYGVERREMDLATDDVGSYFPAAFKVHGEVGTDWCEMVEVASYMNADGDGCIYFVGSTETGLILKPSWREIKWMADYASRMLFHEAHWTTEELMAWALMIGGDWSELL